MARLAFVRIGQAAGPTVAVIGSITDLHDEGPVPCSQVLLLLETELADVRARRRSLSSLQAELEHVIERSHGLDPALWSDSQACHILGR